MLVYVIYPVSFPTKQDILIWSTSTSDMTAPWSPSGTLSSLLHSFIYCTPQSSEHNKANASNLIIQMSSNKWVGWGAKSERKTRGWLAEGMSKELRDKQREGGWQRGRRRQVWELTRGGKNGEGGQLNIHYQATGEKCYCVWDYCWHPHLTTLKLYGTCCMRPSSTTSSYISSTAATSPAGRYITVNQTPRALTMASTAQCPCLRK